MSLLALHMHMGRLLSIAGVEEYPVWARSENGRHPFVRMKWTKNRHLN